MTPRTYQALALRKGLQLYARTGMKVNNAWTLTDMLKTAARITGAAAYKRSPPGTRQAIEDLTRWIELQP